MIQRAWDCILWDSDFQIWNGGNWEKIARPLFSLL